MIQASQLQKGKLWQGSLLQYIICFNKGKEALSTIRKKIVFPFSHEFQGKEQSGRNKTVFDNKE